jgi:hypothetical protein
MAALVANMFTSLDGVLQGPGAPDEDREAGFASGGWQAPYSTRSQARSSATILRACRRCCLPQDR